MALPHIQVRTLTDGGRRAEQATGWIAEFLGGAQRSLDLAFWLRSVSGRGAGIRFAFNLDDGRYPAIRVPEDL